MGSNQVESFQRHTKGKHILIVEDDSHLADILARLAQRYGIRVSHAESGTKALDAIKQELPDFILLDLGLPDMSGLAVVTRVRRDEKQGPFLS
jgi:DNA-binding response OmpR family regulator